MDPFSAALSTRSPFDAQLTGDGEDEAVLLPIILGEVRAFCAKHIDGARIDREGQLGFDVLAGVADRGWFGLTVPARFGGAGLSIASAARVVSELAAHNGSLGTCVGLHTGLALNALLRHGQPSAQEQYLPEIARGRRIVAFAATEPGAGSDISSVRTTLSEREGELWLDGSKSYVTNGGICGLLTVLARSPGLGGARAGHTLVLVDPRAPGVTRGREENKLGLKGSSTLTISFENVEISRDHVLGEVSKGLDHAHEALSWGRTFLAAGCAGTARAALADAIEHTRQREQFGRPLASFPLVAEAIARSRAELLTIESALELVCSFADAKSAALAPASSILKVLASEGSWRIVDRGLQLMGAAGYLEDSGMARRLRDVRVTRIFEGANDVLRMSLAAAALAWPLAAFKELEATTRAASALMSDAQLWETAFADFSAKLSTVKRRWGCRLFEEQAIAAKLADGTIALFGALAVLLTSARSDALDIPIRRLAIALELERAQACLAEVLESRDGAVQRLLHADAAELANTHVTLARA
ncbi:MAG: acyl-CoA dehydrogenase family protein [Myxococcota bacterium]